MDSNRDFLSTTIEKTFSIPQFLPNTAKEWVSDSDTIYVGREKECMVDPEILTEKIVTQNKTFLVDLKKNQAGFYLKVSEWSNSKKSSIFLPAEGIDRMIEILNQFKSRISDNENTKDPELGAF
nr:RNA-binding protein [Leptospira wolbachii]